jgi:hypothetical protein
VEGWVLSVLRLLRLDRIRLPGDRELPAGEDEIRFGEVGAVRLNGVARCPEDRRVGVGVAEFLLRDLGQCVARPDDVRAVGRVVRDGDLEHASGQEEVGTPVEDGLVEGDELDVPGAVTEAFFGDLPEAVAALDRVALGLRLRSLHLVFGLRLRRRLDGDCGLRFLQHGCCDRGMRARLGERGAHCRDGDEQQRRGRDQAVGGELRNGETRQARRTDSASSRHDRRKELEREDGPRDPADGGDEL